jgi:hypothetical protein
VGWIRDNKDRQSKYTITEDEAITGMAEWEKAISKELGKPIKLSGEQRKATIAMCCGNGITTQIAGHAGTGKTFAIQASEYCLTKAGFTKAGSAVSGRAAENLSTEGLSGAKAMSVASFLKSYENESERRSPLPNILFLDEAGTANSEQLSKILKIGREADTDFRVICSYDMKQTQAIGPTGLMLDVIKETGQQELTQVQRQKTAEALKVATLARDGDLTELKNHLLAQKRFDGADSWYSVKKDRGEQIQELKSIYMKNPLPAKDKLLVGLLRADIEDLNHAVRAERVARGEIAQGKSVLCSYKKDESALATKTTIREEKLRDFSVGDRIIIKEGFKVNIPFNEKEKFINATRAMKGEDPLRQKKEKLLTGYAGEIIEQNPHDNFMRVRFDNGKTVSFDLSKEGQNMVDHYYAGTVNATQGASVSWCAGMDAGFQDKQYAKNIEAGGASKELAELGHNRNLLHTILTRHKLEANFVTTMALDKTFEQRYGAYGLEESTLGKVKPQEQTKPMTPAKAVATATATAPAKSDLGKLSDYLDREDAKTLTMPAPAKAVATATPPAPEQAKPWRPAETKVETVDERIARAKARVASKQAMPEPGTVVWLDKAPAKAQEPEKAIATAKPTPTAPTKAQEPAKAVQEPDFTSMQQQHDDLMARVEKLTNTKIQGPMQVSPAPEPAKAIEGQEKIFGKATAPIETVNKTEKAVATAKEPTAKIEATAPTPAPAKKTFMEKVAGYFKPETAKIEATKILTEAQAMVKAIEATKPAPTPTAKIDVSKAQAKAQAHAKNFSGCWRWSITAHKRRTNKVTV